MEKDEFYRLICPLCRNRLSPRKSDKDECSVGDRILFCQEDHTFFVRDGIPRFVEQHYAVSFGMQWKIHARTQIDRFNGATISRDRFLRETQWTPEELVGKRLLDVGAGAGRFTQIALDAGAIVFAMDASSAVEVNKKNNGPHQNLFVIQADILDMPFPQEFFDYIICFGVLQHTPDPEKTFRSLLPYLKKGGKIAIDVYPRKFKYMVHPKYWLRPLTTRIPKNLLYVIIRRITPSLMVLSNRVKKIPFAGGKISAFLPVANYSGYFPLDAKQLLDWAILDTFDMFSPKYDNPQRKTTIEQWFLNRAFKILKSLIWAHTSQEA